MTHCRQEMCTHWTGDGGVCPCVLFDLKPNTPDWLTDEEPTDGR